MAEARDLRQRGIRAAKAGDKDEARSLLQESIRLEPDNEAAWLWLASVARDNRERMFCLQKLLEINPNNETALKALEAANQPTAAPTVKRLPNAPVTRVASPDINAQQPGVPVPMPDRIAEAQKQAETVVRRYLAPPQTATKWVHKTRRRAGEGDIIVYRMYVAGGILAVLIVLAVAGVVLVQTNDDVREVVLGPSATFTPSPTVTPTHTPGLTPTPSPTPRLSPTPSATVPPNVLAASPPALPRATREYPEILERGVFESVLLMNQGDYARAVPTLARERQLTFDTRLDPNPYYYEALGLMKQQRFDDAIETLDEATDRVGERPDALWIPSFLDAGYAQVYWAQAQQATANGNAALANEAREQARTHAEAAISGDARLAKPYIVMAEIRTAARQYGDAIEILNQGLAVPDLTSNTELMMQKAQVYLTQRNYEQALYQIYLTLYTDPSIEAAYQMKIRIALLRNRPGDAVLAAEDYLYYYPGSTTAYRLLGEAREAEGKDDLALAAYAQGLAGDVRDAAAQEMLEARARIYERQRRYDLALLDYEELYGISSSLVARSGRMQAAFNAGEYTLALADAEALAGRSVAQGVVNFVRGAALIELAADEGSGSLSEALGYLNQALAAQDVVSSTSLRGAAYEYLARAQLGLGNEEAALNAISAALDLDETGSRHYWRGRIYEADNQPRRAMRDYEWVLAWSEIFPYPFRVDAEDRLVELRG